MKKALLSLICALALLLAAVTPAMAAQGVANANTDTGLDIVVVIDRSGTMPKTDPNNIALAATNMLADIAEPQSTDIAVLFYGYDIILDTGFVELGDPNGVKALKDQINNTPMPDKEDTNTGGALKRAKELIDAYRMDHPDHTFAVLVLSDGKIEFNSSDGFKAEAKARGVSPDNAQFRAELENESRRQGNDVANACASEGVTISCLGIYPNNDRSKLGTDMSSWSNTTHGTYIEINDINETYRCIDEIYMNIRGQADDQYIIGANGEFDIPAGVSDATIKVVPGTPGSNLELVRQESDGSWTGVSLASANLVETNYYTTVRLNWPQEGHYRIAFLQGQLADAQLISINYGRELVMTLTAPQSMRNQETTGDVVLQVLRQGKAFYDPNVAQPVVQVRDEQGQFLQDLMTRWDAQSECYYADFTPMQIGTYTLQAYQELSGRSVSNAVTIQVGKASIRKAADVGDIEFTGHALHIYDAEGNASDGYQPVEIVVSEQPWFSDPDGVGIAKYEAKLKNAADEAFVQLIYDDPARKLTIIPRSQDTVAQQPARVAFGVYAYGYDGTISEPAEGTVIVEDLQAPVGHALDAAASDLASKGYTLETMLPQKAPVEVLANVGGLFVEPNAADGEAFDWAPAVADESVLTVERDGERLLLTGLKEGQTQVSLTATSYDGSTDTISFQVTVRNRMKTLLLIGGGVLAALVVLGAIVFIVVQKNKPRFRKNAVLGVRLINEDQDQEGSCILLRFGKGPAKMSELCTKCGISVSGLRKELEGIKVYPRKTASIEVHYKSDKKSVVSTLSQNDSKEITLDRDGDVLLVLTYIEDTEDEYY